MRKRERVRERESERARERESESERGMMLIMMIGSPQSKESLTFAISGAFLHKMIKSENSIENRRSGTGSDYSNYVQ